MPCIPMKDGWICVPGEYNPGDPKPHGYMDVVEWARVQMRAGLTQTQCVACGHWLFPQQFKDHQCGEGNE